MKLEMFPVPLTESCLTVSTFPGAAEWKGTFADSDWFFPASIKSRQKDAPPAWLPPWLSKPWMTNHSCSSGKGRCIRLVDGRGSLAASSELTRFAETGTIEALPTLVKGRDRLAGRPPGGTCPNT
jgi:hypothetical protein